MNIFKKQILWFMMLSIVFMPIQPLKAEFFTQQFAEDIVKNVTAGTLIALITAGIFYSAEFYLDSIASEESVTIIEADEEVEKNDSGDVSLENKEQALKDKKAESYINIYYPGVIKTTFADVAGLSGAKAALQDIISYLKNPHAYDKIGARIPKGVLMNGCPGNGKTLLARAVAGEAHCPFISCSGAAFADMYVSVGALRVRQLFTTARSLAQEYGACIIFIDEIDSIAQKRSGSGQGADRDYNHTINQLLQSMDGLERETNPIVFIAATNRIEVLDSAVVRPGRFDRKVEVSKPEIQDRIELLSGALKKVLHASNINIVSIARITSGFSGAKLALLINEAAIIAVNSGKESIDIDDIELAYDYITLGREIQGGERNNADKWETAIHEAGHAVGYLFGNNRKYAIHKASIVPRSSSLGVIWTVEIHESHKLTQDDMMATIVMCLCGGLAEQEFGFGKSTGPSSDLAHARAIAYDMVVKYGMSPQLNYLSYDAIDKSLPNDIGTEVHKEVQKIIKECFVVAQKLVASHKKDIEKIASLLMEKGTVLGDEIYQLVGMSSPSIEVQVAI